MEIIRKHWLSPVPITIMLIVAAFGFLLLEIPRGILSQSGDEMLTAERSREMVLLGRSAVHFNFSPSFEKPPLQYWLSSLTLPHFKNKTLAVRVWPWFYGILTAISVACLATILEPEKPWLPPLSVALLVSCPLFATDASRALLDTGLAFFTTATIIFVLLARRNPIWWLGVAAACSFGSLQKIPLPFLVWLLILGVWLISKTERSKLGTGWLPVSILAALIAMAAWPVIQLLHYQVPIRSLFHQEIVDHLGPERLGSNPYLEVPYRFAITSACGLFLLAAPIVILFFLKRWNFKTTAFEISIVCLAFIALEVLFNFRNVRYIEPIVPTLCVLLAMVLYRLLDRPPVVRAAASVLIVVLLIAGFIQTDLQISYRRKNLADEKRVAEELGTLQHDGVHTVLVKAVKVGNDLHFGSFYLFHGNLRYPITKLTVEQIQQTPPPTPLIGVCVERDFPLIRATYPAAQIRFSRAKFVLWRVD